ncbi:TetR/AcrR family transcriptional regulator [Schleiferilactobacillus harbinensis]|uniref:TetR family transcriptional regulator n=1 Tax=Schleiferilactobacillus harbinensis TaxID=304207 RepID=A0A5P8M2T2_9LACO|nr:TetR/AcrR family transcriptional regulator [Schleiferilactobacillus harbinensis]QFR22753.1 TetR family transcriptional regulator [Schleiferilactobacillus harbinensis]
MLHLQHHCYYTTLNGECLPKTGRRYIEEETVTGNRESNALTKESIFTGLLELMATKEFAQISVTAIAKRAGVSRMAFYRNYQTKEDILKDYLDHLFQQYLAQMTLEQGDLHALAVGFFQYFRRNQSFLDALITANLQFLLLPKFTHYLPEVFRQLLPGSPSPMVIQFDVGGLYQLLVAWAQEGMVRSDEEMAQVVVHFQPKK